MRCTVAAPLRGLQRCNVQRLPIFSSKNKQKGCTMSRKKRQKLETVCAAFKGEEIIPDDEDAPPACLARQCLQGAKKAGIDADAIKNWVKLLKRDPDDVAREFAWANHIYVLRDLPIAWQLKHYVTASVVTNVKKETQPTKRGRPRGSRNKPEDNGEK